MFKFSFLQKSLWDYNKKLSKFDLISLPTRRQRYEYLKICTRLWIHRLYFYLFKLFISRYLGDRPLHGFLCVKSHLFKKGYKIKHYLNIKFDPNCQSLFRHSSIPIRIYLHVYTYTWRPNTFVIEAYKNNKVLHIKPIVRMSRTYDESLNVESKILHKKNVGIQEHALK